MSEPDPLPVADTASGVLAPPMASSAELPEAWVRLAAARMRAVARARAKARRRIIAVLIAVALAAGLTAAAIYGAPALRKAAEVRAVAAAGV